VIYSRGSGRRPFFQRPRLARVDRVLGDEDAADRSEVGEDVVGVAPGDEGGGGLEETEGMKFERKSVVSSARPPGKR
jgi:hypothetical protein